MDAAKYRVVKDHQSEYPEPINFAQGTTLCVGEKYQGDEGWDDWFLCHCSGQKAGWVPAQIIEFRSNDIAIALEDYSARELNVRCGEMVFGLRILNGWVWCNHSDGRNSGWVPLLNLQLI